MDSILHLILVWAVIAVALYIVSKLPLGVEVDSVEKTVISAAAFGILNAVLFSVAKFLTFGGLGGILTPLLFLVANVVAFGLAAWLIEGFRLKWGVMSAILGGFVLSVLISVIRTVLPVV
jgi:putative membrane protein